MHRRITIFYTFFLGANCHGVPWKATLNNTREKGVYFIWVCSSFLPCRWKDGFANFPHSLSFKWNTHLVGTKLITASKLVDWRMNLSQFHLAQSQKLWQEAQVDMLMEPGNPDSECIRVLDNTFNQLASTTKQLLDLRAKKATGTSKIIDCNILTTDKSPSNPTKEPWKPLGPILSWPVNLTLMSSQLQQQQPQQ